MNSKSKVLYWSIVGFCWCIALASIGMAIRAAFA